MSEGMENNEFSLENQIRQASLRQIEGIAQKTIDGGRAKELSTIAREVVENFPDKAWVIGKTLGGSDGLEIQSLSARIMLNSGASYDHDIQKEVADFKEKHPHLVS